MKKALSILLSVCVILTAVISLSFTAGSAIIPAANTGATSGATGDCTWTLDGTELTISGSGKMRDRDGAMDVEDYWGADVTKVTIADGVESIGDFAFFDCKKLEEITIPDSVKSIGWCAFDGCKSLKSVTIPKSVTEIEWYAFDDCTALESIDLKNENAEIGGGAFRYTPWLDSFPDGMIYLGKTAYKYKGECPAQFTVKEGTEAIGDEAFYGQKELVKVIIPDGVKKIGTLASP